MANYDSQFTGAQIDAAVDKVRNPDTTPTASSAALITSGGVAAAISAEAARAEAAEALKAPLASPALTGTPTVPDASAAANSSQIANTRFVKTAISGKQDTLTFDDAPTSGSSNPVKSGGIYDALALKAPLYSPTFAGTPKAPTPPSLDNSTKIATTEFVKMALAEMAPLASPSFTGTPTAPTPSYDDNSQKIANTAFVKYWTAMLLSQFSAALSEDVTFTFEADGLGSGSSGRVTKIGRMVFFDFYIYAPNNIPANTHLISIDAVMSALPDRQVTLHFMANADRGNLSYEYVAQALNHYFPQVIAMPRPSYNSTAIVSSKAIDSGTYYFSGFFET